MDKNALEEAIRLREKNGGKVTVLALGAGKLRDAMIEALAMGADEGVILTDPLLAGCDSAAVAQALAAAIRRIGRFELVLAAEGSTDNYSGQVGPRLAEELDLPQITFVRELAVAEGRLTATRTLEDAFEVVACGLPALVTVTQEINTPRLPPLTAILRASRKPQQTWSAADVGMGAPVRLVERLGELAPEQSRKNIILEGDDAPARLLDALAREGVLE
jgi:electron transfer flavoprotein beta subunit